MSRVRRPLLVVLAFILAAPVVQSAEKTMSRSEREQAAKINAQLGMTYMRQDDLVTARQKIEKALEQDSHSTEAQMAAGFLYDRLGEDRKAETHFELAIKYGRDNPDSLNNFAVFLCRKGDKKRGEAYFLQAAESPLYRTPDVAYSNAGRCARADERGKDAEKYFRKALAIRPDQQDALFQLADLSHESGNNLQARAFLQRYLAVAPTSSQSLWLGYRIEKALGDSQQAQDYARRLTRDFATSTEAGKLLEAERAAQ